MKDVPNEIYLKIFKQVAKRDLVNCVLVCKSWSTPANQTLHTNVHLKGNDVLFIQSELSQQDQDQHPFFRQGRWTKSLGIWFDEDDDDDILADSAQFGEAEFCTLLSYLPNLKRLDMTGSSHSLFYLQYLKKIDSKTNLRKLEEIRVQNVNCTQEYKGCTFIARLNFYKSLTHLDIFFANQKFTSNNGKSVGALHLLPRFTNLTHLEVQNHQYQDLTAFQLLDMFPGLVVLKFQSNMNPNDVEESLLSGVEKKNNKLLAVQLKSLVLSLSKLTRHYIQNFITCFSAGQLNDFKIYMNSVTFHEWTRNVSVELALEFAKSLSQIKNVEISFQSAHQPEQNTSFEQTSGNVKTTTFYQFLGALVRNRKLSNCAATYYGGYIRQEVPSITIKDNAHLSFRHVLDFHPGSGYKLSVPFKQANVLPAIIKNAKVFLAGEEAVPITTPCKLIQSILENCPNLEDLLAHCYDTNFKLMADNSIAIDNGNASKSNSLSTFLPTRQQQQQRKGNFTRIRLSGSALTQSLIDVLSTHQQNIKAIVCSAQVIGDNFDLDELQNDPTLDLTGLNSLQNFTFCVKNVIAGDFDHLFIHFIYHSKNDDNDDDKVIEEHCYYDIRPLETRSRTYSCTSTTPTFIRQCQEDTSVESKSVTFKCNKIPEFVLFTGSSALTPIAKFSFGELLYTTSARKHPQSPKRIS